VGSPLMAKRLQPVSLCFVKNFTIITQRVTTTIFSRSCLWFCIAHLLKCSCKGDITLTLAIKA